MAAVVAVPADGAGRFVHTLILINAVELLLYSGRDT